MKRNLIACITNFFFPAECVGCHKEDFWLCSDCRKTIPSAPWKFPEQISGIGDLFALTDYQNPLIARVIRRIKFGYCREMLNDLDPLLEERLRSLSLPENAILVPVPLHFFRKSSRGFNQAELLAKAMGKYINKPVRSILRRTRNTPPQTTLSGEKRRDNLSGAFRVVLPEYKSHPIYVVDDVTTTHTTLRECIHTLQKAGFHAAGALVLAKSEEHYAPH